MVVVGSGKSGNSRFLKTEYPITEGLIAGSTKLPSEEHLKPEEDVAEDMDGVYGR